jgi:Cytochrome C oxidase, cbb3-type, subunit III
MAKNTKLQRAWQILLSTVFLCVPVRAGAAGQTTPQGNQQLPPLIRSLKGPDLFRAYCASCHGLDARGGGPAATALKVKPTDLTLLARNNRGEFPTAHGRETIMGGQLVAAHGSRRMPIWGPVFHQVEEDVDRGNVRLENLVAYLELIQTTHSSTPVSGAELAHGLSEMPIWGLDFRAGEGLNAAQVTLRITELTNYIKSRQAK